jgi:hypothetical protein
MAEFKNLSFPKIAKWVKWISIFSIFLLIICKNYLTFYLFKICVVLFFGIFSFGIIGDCISINKKLWGKKKYFQLTISVLVYVLALLGAGVFLFYFVFR